MSTAATPGRYFTWQRFAKVALVQIAVVGALEVFWYSRSGLTTPALAVVPAVIWINVLYALRWRDLIKQELSGELSMQDYHADPFEYLMGSRRHWTITVVGGALVGLLWILVAELF